MTTLDPITECLRGEISPEVALSRLVLSGATTSSIHFRLEASTIRNERWAALRRLLTTATVDRLRHVLDVAGVRHDAAVTPARIAEQFDRAVSASPEASVAMYSLGERSILDAATREIIDWLQMEGLIHPSAAVLDLGCGIGRIAGTLAGQVRRVHGIDVSTAMIEEARRRCAGVSNVSFAATTGSDLTSIADASYDLLLAVDTFPYLVQTGLAEAHIVESRRVLRQNGCLAVLNLSYRGDLNLDQKDAEAWATAYGFTLQHQAARPFRLWDGACWTFQRMETTST